MYEATTLIRITLPSGTDLELEPGAEVDPAVLSPAQLAQLVKSKALVPVKPAAKKEA